MLITTIDKLGKRSNSEDLDNQWSWKSVKEKCVERLKIGYFLLKFFIKQTVHLLKMWKQNCYWELSTTCTKTVVPNDMLDVQ